jgi:hypothetical protein
LEWEALWGRPDLNKAARKAHPEPILPQACWQYYDALYVLKGDRLNTQPGRLSFIPFTAIERYASRYISPHEFDQFVDTLIEIDSQFVKQENLRNQQRAENGRNKNN